MTVTQLAPRNIRPFLLAGKAIFTVKNSQTGRRFTFRIQTCKENPALFFVAVLAGADNETDYQYLGTIHQDRYTYGRKSRIGEQAFSAQAFQWVWTHIDRLPGCIQVCHAGRCGRCGRLLTVPESLEQGFGPECVQKV